ncbi:hypothetical protein F2Q69_00017982 [Brassica cretica]|uniref:Uncharacterized protein n=1 Tax=Brassica cretica TaxID=69181 RepID=A0A8S9R8F8_BRACR|nr:hypothetical protein F2Q69_00017982 [Brassica cretica]
MQISFGWRKTTALTKESDCSSEKKQKKESDIDGLTSSQSRAEQTIRGGRHEYLRLNPPSPPRTTRPKTRPQAETRTTLINSKEQQSRTRMKLKTSSETSTQPKPPKTRFEITPPRGKPRTQEEEEE